MDNLKNCIPINEPVNRSLARLLDLIETSSGRDYDGEGNVCSYYESYPNFTQPLILENIVELSNYLKLDIPYKESWLIPAEPWDMPEGRYKEVNTFLETVFEKLYAQKQLTEDKPNVKLYKLNWQDILYKVEDMVWYID